MKIGAWGGHTGHDTSRLMVRDRLLVVSLHSRPDIYKQLSLCITSVELLRRAQLLDSISAYQPVTTTPNVSPGITMFNLLIFTLAVSLALGSPHPPLHRRSGSTPQLMCETSGHSRICFDNGVVSGSCSNRRPRANVAIVRLPRAEDNKHLRVLPPQSF